MMATRIGQATTERRVLVASPEGALDGRRERNPLASSSGGPDRRRNVDPVRRNEQMALKQRPGR
jgi:hypothetical protein